MTERAHPESPRQGPPAVRALELDSLEPYRSPEARVAALHDRARRSGGEVVPYGTSVEGEPLLAVRFPARDPGRPRVLCCAGIHGPEWIGIELALALAAAMGEDQGAGLRATAEVWVAPCLNPDGYRRTWELRGRGTLATLRTNARGVDLNRNFPRPGAAGPSRWPGAGSDRPGDATYRGPAPLSEPETAALDRLFTDVGFVAASNLHSFMGTVIPAHVRDRPAYDTYRRLCRGFFAAQPRVRYRRLASRRFDVFTGEQEDHQHHRHGTWAICVEAFSIAASLRQHLRAPTKFWRFNPRDPRPWIDNDLPALLAYLQGAAELAPPERRVITATS